MKSTPSTIVPNEFGTSADKIEPSTALESAGYIPAQQLPAEHMNWFMSLLTRLARSDNPSLRDLWSELNTVLTAAGLSADNATVTQVKAALDALYLLKSAYGTNWLLAIQTALGADWKTALAATAGAGILTELKKVDGSGSELDSDRLDGAHAGNASGNIPISNGTLNVNLNADQLDSRHAGNSNGNIPISNGSICTNLNAQKAGNKDFVNGTALASVASYTISPLASAYIPSGLLMLCSDAYGDIVVEAYVTSPSPGWYQITQGASGSYSALFLSDGVNFVLKNRSGSADRTAQLFKYA